MLSASVTWASRSLASDVLQVEGGLGFLLPGQGDLRERREPLSVAGLPPIRARRGPSRRRSGRPRSSAETRQGVVRSLDAEDDLLVLAVEAEVGCQQSLLGRVQGAGAPSEIKQQPSQIQRGGYLLHVHAKKPVRARRSPGRGEATLL